MPQARRVRVDIDGNIWLEVLIRALLSILFLELEGATPFVRVIQPDELWLYKNPRTNSYVPSSVLWPLVFLTPTIVILIVFLVQKDKTDVCQAILALSLALAMNGVLTNTVKIIVGRPRPDFFWRCFPDGRSNSEMDCTGDSRTVAEGRKSFPSGHSSFAFTSGGFLAFYLAAKLHVFSPFALSKGVRGVGVEGGGETSWLLLSSGGWSGVVKRQRSGWRLCISLLPVVGALLIALSRTCDYHHHWQDVVCGSLLGLSVSYLCYRQYFPPLSSPLCSQPYVSLDVRSPPRPPLPVSPSSSSTQDGFELIPEQQVKWI
ncbi:phospholipid phosphatase 4 [Ischnura elegans]|uniref:phospholipid phosphatase 4 n=1 Tax=Ischnura elegans TaxID=197161 RepID=UPI001ED87F71|nr:phospholipid phosphatase 4 [Ischnura elegans]